MLLSPRADERAALHFDDLASALDAGLPFAAIGADPAQDRGDRTIHALLEARGVALSTTEDAVLLAGWQAGRLAPALRARAREREQRAAWKRSVWASLRYPLLLLVMVVVASAATTALTGNLYAAFAALAFAAVVAIAAVVIVRGLRTGGERWTQLPIVGPLARDLGELPYLETMHALYASGVPVPRAHQTATATVPIASVRRRLEVADRVLQGGEPLATALARGLALHPETRSLLQSSEAAGQLEDALGRALARRRERAGRGVANVSRWFGNTIYAVAVIGCVVVIFNFYLAYANMLGRAGH